jgi:2-desacetyl-2-hydroxyethyl bacteriochlorophyllide A dehydrogenase
MMRRVVVGADTVTVVEAPVPEPGPGEVLVRVRLAGICGSDTHALQGLHPFIDLPYAAGHEVVGTVERVAGDVTRVAPGHRVVLEPYLPCWDCKQCRAGRPNICERLRFFGCAHDQGGMADYYTVDERRLHVIPDALTWEQAAMIEPLATPVHAVRLAGGVEGRAVAILGAGTIGLLTMMVARAGGARSIVMTARSAANRDRAAAFGATAVDAADAPAAVRDALGESADVVFDCVASQPTITQGLDLAGKGGTVVVVGVPAADVSIPLPVLQDSQLRIQGSATYLPEDFASAIALLESGSVDVSGMVTGIHPLGEAAAAFRAAASGGQIKVLLSVSDLEGCGGRTQ